MLWVLLSILAFVLAVGGTFQICRCCLRDLTSEGSTWETMIGFASLMLGGTIVILIDHFLPVM